MATCVTEIAGNIGLDCTNPLEGGYTGRAILIPLESVPTLTKSSTNPRIISAISIASGKKVVSVDNEGSSPFDGSQTAGNNDAGYTKFTKSVNVRIPMRGAAAAKDVIEPLIKSGRGFIGIFEKVDRVGDGSFEVVGALKPLKCLDPSTAVRQEGANGGAWTVTLTTDETYAEVVFFDTDYDTTLEDFETLLESAF